MLQTPLQAPPLEGRGERRLLRQNLRQTPAAVPLAVAPPLPSRGGEGVGSVILTSYTIVPGYSFTITYKFHYPL